MTYKAKLFNSLNVPKDAQSVAVDDGYLADLMVNPEYLRHSSTIINEALKEGFDVLQLPNGDIVTTGTKTIVNTYVWDAKSARLEKTRTPAEKAMRVRKAAVAKVAEEEDAE